MKLESQVCSLEQAKKLKELGVVQISNFSYGKRYTPFLTELQLNSDGTLPLACWELFSNCDFVPEGNYSAFTSSELGYALGAEVINVRYDVQTAMWYSIEETHEETVYSFASQNEAQCRADLLISLIESQDANIGFVNQALTTS